jgi:serine protease DegQ
MQRISRGLGAVLLTVAVLVSPLTACAEMLPVGRDGIPTLAPMLERAMPAVVSIAVRGYIPAEENPLYRDPQFRESFGDPEPMQFGAAGSGVIVDAARGHVLTTRHVIEDAEEIVIWLSDGRHLRAEVIGADPATDIALLRIPAERLTDLPLGDSDALRVGDFVVAIGNPFGLTQSVTSGIVSAIGRGSRGFAGYGGYIQTDASLNPGDSGGPLIDLQGRLVGINTAIVGPYGGNVGIGFAVPVNVVRRSMADLLAHAEIPPRRESRSGSSPGGSQAQKANAPGIAQPR